MTAEQRTELRRIAEQLGCISDNLSRAVVLAEQTANEIRQAVRESDERMRPHLAVLRGARARAGGCHYYEGSWR